MQVVEEREMVEQLVGEDVLEEEGEGVVVPWGEMEWVVVVEGVEEEVTLSVLEPEGQGVSVGVEDKVGGLEVVGLGPFVTVLLSDTLIVGDMERDRVTELVAETEGQEEREGVAVAR